MAQHHKYSINEIEELIPFERDIYVDMLLEYLKEERERKNREEAHEKRQTKKKDTKEIEMSITSLKKEHKHLIEVLKSGSLKDRMKEARSQGKEMKKY